VPLFADRMVGIVRVDHKLAGGGERGQVRRGAHTDRSPLQRRRVMRGVGCKSVRERRNRRDKFGRIDRFGQMDMEPCS
jgi:hypothetical protein